MAVMMARLYDALKAAGVADDKAISAAEEAAADRAAADKILLSSIDQRLASLESSIDQRLASLEKLLDVKFSSLDVRFAAIERKLNLLIWIAGINAAATITMLVKHW